MKQEHEIIVNIISQYLEKNPEQRFGQALANLNINQFADKKNPSSKDCLLRDIYNDSDESILGRMAENETERKDSKEPIKQSILERYPDEVFIFADGFDSAIIGVDSESTPMRIIYSSQKAIDIIYSEMSFTKADLTREDYEEGHTVESKKMELSVEHFDFNVKGSKGEGFPVWCDSVVD